MEDAALAQLAGAFHAPLPPPPPQQVRGLAVACLMKQR